MSRVSLDTHSALSPPDLTVTLSPSDSAGDGRDSFGALLERARRSVGPESTPTPRTTDDSRPSLDAQKSAHASESAAGRTTRSSDATPDNDAPDIPHAANHTQRESPDESEQRSSDEDHTASSDTASEPSSVPQSEVDTDMTAVGSDELTDESGDEAEEKAEDEDVPVLCAATPTDSPVPATEHATEEPSAAGNDDPPNDSSVRPLPTPANTLPPSTRPAAVTTSSEDGETADESAEPAAETKQSPGQYAQGISDAGSAQAAQGAESQAKNQADKPDQNADGKPTASDEEPAKDSRFADDRVNKTSETARREPTATQSANHPQTAQTAPDTVIAAAAAVSAPAPAEGKNEQSDASDIGGTQRVGQTSTTSAADTQSSQDGSEVSQADRIRFVQRVARAFESLGDRGGSIRLRLSPPELGALRLEVTVRNGVMNARLETESQAAQSMLLNNLPALRERLAAQNIRIEQFDVTLTDQSQGGLSGGTDAQNQSQQGGYQPRPYYRDSPETAVQSVTGPRRSTAAGGMSEFDVVI